jgi:hypothetical protein
MERKEIYGDDLVRLLDAQHFVKPDIDWTDEAVWPQIMNWSRPAAVDSPSSDHERRPPEAHG